MKIYRNTVSDDLWQILNQLMSNELFVNFRLVGGTGLSLQLGHRKSVDIDLFTDAEYGSIDFNAIQNQLVNQFKIVETIPIDLVGPGKSFFIGESLSQMVKLDLFYTDLFVFPHQKINEIHLANIKEIAAMKLEVIGNGGRKKDFWDIHELLDYFSLSDLLSFYEKRYPFHKTKSEILLCLIDFKYADDDFQPVCLKGKYWELIKTDLNEWVKSMMNNSE